MSDETLDEFIAEYKPYEKFPALNRRLNLLFLKTLVRVGLLTGSFFVTNTVRGKLLKMCGKNSAQVNKTIDASGEVYAKRFDKIERELVEAEMKLEDKYL